MVRCCWSEKLEIVAHYTTGKGKIEAPFGGVWGGAGGGNVPAGSYWPVNKKRNQPEKADSL